MLFLFHFDVHKLHSSLPLQLGALTQGDRRATGQSNALGLSTFDMDNKFGTKALRTMLSSIWDCSSSALDSEATDGMFAEALKVIDAHLTDILQEGDNWQANLSPYSEDNQSEQTYYKFMKELLGGPCLQLASKRVEAIKDDRSVAKYFKQLFDGTGDKEVLKPKIDQELSASKEVGLNFHVLCYLWLYEVGVTQETAQPGKFRRPPIGVPKFLNR